MRIDHPWNVNQKYTSFFKIVPDEFVGEGIRRTNKCQSRGSRQEWVNKKQEFWETRIEGRKENWLVIRMAIDVNENDALIMLASAELKLVNNSM
jgi:hypothetical protein